MATGHRAERARGNFRCPGCGAWESEGCQDPKKCAHTLAGMERECAREIVGALNNRSSKDTTGLLGLEALDLLSIGLVVSNASGQLLLANRTAEEILRTRDGLELNSHGVLCTVRRCGQPASEVLLRAARVAPSQEFGSSDAAFRVQRASAKPALTVVVRSIRRMSATEGPALPAALVLILDSALSVKTTEAELNQLYGLTATEARLANLLTEGKALDDCCRELGISRSTACTHLKRLFKKTRVRRQSELVCLLLKSIGLARLGSAATRNPFALGFAALNGQLGKDLAAGAARMTGNS